MLLAIIDFIFTTTHSGYLPDRPWIARSGTFITVLTIAIPTFLQINYIEAIAIKKEAYLAVDLPSL